MGQIWDTQMENREQFNITIVEKLIEFVGKRKIISQFDSYLPKMVNRYVVTEHRRTIFSRS
jgi:hypothetical protein